MMARKTSTTTAAADRTLEELTLLTLPSAGFLERVQFFPHVVVGVPVWQLDARDLQFGNGQGAVSIRADVLRSRRPYEHRTSPGTGLHRHPQPTRARPAAITLVRS